MNGWITVTLYKNLYNMNDVTIQRKPHECIGDWILFMYSCMKYIHIV